MSAQPNDTQPTSIELAREACSQFVEEVQGQGAVMTTAVLLYEVGYMNDEGELEYKITYSVLTDSGMAAAAGVIALGGDVFMDAVTSDDD